MTGRGRTFGTIALLVAAGLALTADARVYRSLGFFMGRALFNAELLGKAVYRAAMQINGGNAEVTVVQAREDMAGIRRAVQSAGAGQEARFEGGDSLGFGFVSGGDRSVRLLALTPGGRENTLVVTVDQSKQDEKESEASRATHGIPDVPAYPGGAVTCFMKNADTRTCFETQKVQVGADAAAAFYSDALPRNGWAPVFPRGSRAEAGLQVFVKGADLCCVRIKAADSSGESDVTLLHKRGAVE